MNNSSSSAAIESLEPSAVWRFFAGIAATPRPSKHEGQIREHMRKVAQQHKLTVREDAVGNMLLEVPATPGHENAPVTILQGHLDMVTEKNSGTVHDFDKDPIRLVLDKDPVTGEQIVRADGTTLGADNGIGVALGMAAATSPECVHGPLEILLTIDEEMGMTGAKALEPDFLKGRRMLNLDSEEDNAIYYGCAGGMDTNITWDFKLQPTPNTMQVCRVAVSGLRGGHSGGDIHENRANAIKLLARTLNAVGPANIRIATITGGSKRNAIPREASAIVCCRKKTVTELQQAADKVRDEAKAESYEERVSIAVDAVPQDQPPPSMAAKDVARFLEALIAFPSGVLGMHPKVEKLVQTSNNLATIVPTKKENDTILHIDVGMLSRSSLPSLLHGVAAQLASIGRLAGASTIDQGGEYPGWEPNPDSALLGTCRRIYERMFNSKPNVLAIHAGLECGIIGERLGGKLDAVSFGPNLKGAHSPDERCYVASVQKSWRFLKEVLAELAKG